MAHRPVAILTTILIAAAPIVIAQTGGGYDLGWKTLETSGGNAAGVGYSLVSAVHQPIAELSNPSTGGSYSLTSGFLALPPTLPPEPVAGDVWEVR